MVGTEYFQLIGNNSSENGFYLQLSNSISMVVCSHFSLKPSTIGLYFSIQIVYTICKTSLQPNADNLIAKNKKILASSQTTKEA